MTTLPRRRCTRAWMFAPLVGLLGSARIVGLAQAAEPASAAANANAAVPQLTQVAKEVATPVALRAQTPVALAQEARFDGYFGLYVNGKKVGYLHEAIRATPAIEMELELEATLGGMGQSSHVSLRERRRYASTGDGRLIALSFQQKAQTGEITVDGAQKGKHFDVAVVAGGARRRHQLDMPETVADALAAFRLAGAVRGGKTLLPGDYVNAVHFDASSQAVTGAQVTVDKVESQLLGGLPSQVLHLTTRYPTLALEEKSILDARGHLMRMHIGSFFEARREEEAIAKAPVTPGDVLLEAVIAAPQELPGVQQAQEIVLTMSGLGNVTLPESPRQHVQALGQRFEVTLRRDAPIGLQLHMDALHRSLQAPNKRDASPAAKAERAAVQAARKPHAIVQSDAPEIIAMAKRAVGTHTSVERRIDALVRATRAHIHSEYVPSFSNALEVYRSGRGDCTEYSVLFVALARAAGLPARVAVGSAYWPPGNGFGWHAWAEIWTGERWVSVDPTWGQTIADVTHLKVADGDPASQVRLVMLLGQLRLDAWRIVRP